MARELRIFVIVDKAEKAIFQGQANIDGLSLSAWCRRALRDYAARHKDDLPPDKDLFS